MDPKRWQRIQGLFESALKRSPEELAGWLDNACDGDPALQREVEDLLRSDAEAGSFIETAIRGVARRADEDAAPSPRRFGKYEIESKIGQGGFGIVYRGRDPALKRPVAVKTCSTENRDLRRRFFREGQIAAGLQHANITTVHDLGVENGIPYLVQEFLGGEDLDHIINRCDDLPLLSRLEILVQVAKGLEYAHQAGVLHRDIKPANIRVLANGAVKIMDFGIAKLLSDDTQLTGTGMAMGTVGYLAPEQLKGEPIDTRADVFAFGVLAYELLSYQRPFQGKNFSQVSYQLLYVEPRPLAVAWPECPGRIAAWVGRCLEKQPALRYMTLTEVLEELEPMLDALGAGPSSAALDRAGAFPAPLASLGGQRSRAWRRAVWAGMVGFAVLAMVVSTQSSGWFSLASGDAESSTSGALASKSSSVESPELLPLPEESIPSGQPAELPEEHERMGSERTSSTTLVPLSTPEAPRHTAPGPEPGLRRSTAADSVVPNEPFPSSPPPSSPDPPKADLQSPDMAPGMAEPGQEEGGDPDRSIPLDGNARESVPGVGEPSRAALASEPDLIIMKRGDLIVPGDGAVAPRLLDQPQPSYPQSARRRGREARVLVRVLVDENGRVLQAVAPGDRLGFAASAKEAATRASFEPATRDGIAGKMWTEIVFEFKLKS